MDPSSDFRTVGTCKISEVLHRTDYRGEGAGQQNRAQVCFDYYTYRFLHQGVIYKSREEEIRRGTEPCDASTPSPGTFSLNQNAACWQATGDVSELYNINNDAGLKIFDPAEEIDAVMDTAVAFTIAGAALLPSGLILMGVAVALYRCGGCDCNK